jgi:L-Ala-D/L-Glu epimerase
MTRTTIRAVSVETLNMPLLEPFTIATGTASEARNVLISVTLADGSTGYLAVGCFTLPACV